MLIRYQELETQILEIQRQIDALPCGELSCAINGDYYKWYQYIKPDTFYIPKDNRNLAKQLAKKKYLQALLSDLSHEKTAIQFYLNHHKSESKSQKLLLKSEYKSLLSDVFLPPSHDLSEWMSESYERNTNHPEHLIHKSSSGNLVRSKSESLIDMLLHINKIPFRYECALHLDNTTLYPDFTIRHPHTKAFYYWEHFGLMDNPSYAQNALSKIQLYISNGIIPGRNLITTYETTNHPLDFDVIEKIIKIHFSV